MSVNSIVPIPIGLVPYDSIWDGITGQCIHIPSHHLADIGAATNVLSSNSTIALASITCAGIDYTGTGANPGWFTGNDAGANGQQVRAYSDDSALATFFNTETLPVGASILISFFIGLPAGGSTGTSGFISYGRGSLTQPGIQIKILSTNKMDMTYVGDDGAYLQIGGTDAIPVSTVGHVFAEIYKSSATEFTIRVTVNDGTVRSITATQGGLTTLLAGGLNIYSNQTNGGGVSEPIEAGLMCSDIFIARTSIDVQTEIAELRTRQSNIRTSLSAKWKDVL